MTVLRGRVRFRVVDSVSKSELSKTCARLFTFEQSFMNAKRCSHVKSLPTYAAAGALWCCGVVNLVILPRDVCQMNRFATAFKTETS